MAILFFWIFIESFFLTTWGTTPGKWILNTRVRNISGDKLTFQQAINRSFSVWTKGMCLGFPIVFLITFIISYKNLKKYGKSSWDIKGEHVVLHKKISPIRIIVFLPLPLLFFILVNNL